MVKIVHHGGQKYYEFHVGGQYGWWTPNEFREIRKRKKKEGKNTTYHKLNFENKQFLATAGEIKKGHNRYNEAFKRHKKFAKKYASDIPDFGTEKKFRQALNPKSKEFRTL